MISIITAIYNQLEMNKYYLETIRQNTRTDWELIVIDNGSTDGSAEFFETAGPNVRVIRNDANYSYPYCQNRGIEVAKGDVFAFLNNDIKLSPGWDEKMLKVLGRDGYEVLTMSSNDNMLSAREAKRINRRFKRIKYPLLKIFGRHEWVFRAMVTLTYGNWDRFCERLFERDGFRMKPGFAGSAVLMTRKGVEILGPWDETQQGGDFDLFFRTVERWQTNGDVRPMSVVGGVYHHHFSRITFKMRYPKFADSDRLHSLEDKWGDKVLEYKQILSDHEEA